MDHEQALFTAQCNWGDHAWVMETPASGLEPASFLVSAGVKWSMQDDPLYSRYYGVYGEGDSWEAAFAMAAEREAAKEPEETDPEILDAQNNHGQGPEL